MRARSPSAPALCGQGPSGVHLVDTGGASLLPDASRVSRTNALEPGGDAATLATLESLQDSAKTASCTVEYYPRMDGRDEEPQ